MSVDFWCPEAPKKTVSCPWCFAMRADGEISDSEKCCKTCDGTYLSGEGPHINWANANTRTIFFLLGEGQGEWMSGEWLPEEISEVLQVILTLKNVRRRREPADREFSDEGGPGTGRCRYVDLENTDEDTLRRLTSLEELLVYAKTNNYKVVWG